MKVALLLCVVIGGVCTLQAHAVANRQLLQFTFTPEAVQKATSANVAYFSGSTPSCDNEISLSPKVVELNAKCWTQQDAQFAKSQSYTTCFPECTEADAEVGYACAWESTKAIMSAYAEWASLAEKGAFPRTGPVAGYFMSLVDTIEEGTGQELANSVADFANQTTIAGIYSNLLAKIKAYDELCGLGDPNADPKGDSSNDESTTTAGSAAMPLLKPWSNAAGLFIASLAVMAAFV